MHNVGPYAPAELRLRSVTYEVCPHIASLVVDSEQAEESLLYRVVDAVAGHNKFL